MELKRRVLCVIVLLVSVTVLLIFSIRNEKQKEYEKQLQALENSGALNWVECFMKHDFSACDMMLDNPNNGFYNAKVLSLMRDERYYQKTLDSVVDCIQSANVQSVVHLDDGSTEYHILVELVPYKKVDQLVYELDMLDDVKENYKNEKMTDSEFEAELSSLYLRLYCDTVFGINEDATPTQLVLVLSEKEVNGVMRVYGTVSFVDSLLSDSNITHNISVYERDVKENVTNLIKAE